ncbi:FxsA cytoplasmic membrane protein [Haloterrigena turkmenica DSM 5511]|uniref:FxsA cytoplasmic membrane protein n=1 Tax=Haloterrigena turkmenica (strain ATCC 51198 / DSM 5511 / JCM 9101 / NCIMB 13204 / VKM B-1734 / 4k) TaxID=543526 RepID=D2RVM6_HALTV|nr:FxsA family protein [Haloterrigena turkmenica]ADB59390.1 FxsA cytoplasmic membrane protein [Haloterrigena turkmenica DSM 5511]
MLRWILALLLIPFLDAVLLGVLVTQFGAFTWVGMVLLVVLTGLVGMLLVRAEGRRTIGKMQRTLAEGKPPTNELLDGGLLIAAGAFLLTPGLVTDAIGFLLAVPLTRIPIRAALKRFVIIPYADKKTGGFASGNVWTFGFPDEGPARSGDSGSGSTDGGTYDLGAGDYTVDDSDDGDSYTIDFGDERTSDSGDDLDDDPSAR